MEDKTIILSKEDFIQYLKYLKILLKEEYDSTIQLIKDIDECIENELEYTPYVYYYVEASELYSEIINKKVKNNVIIWTEISRWKSYIRKSRIQKLIIENGL